MRTGKAAIVTKLGRLLKAAATFVGLVGVIIIGFQSFWWFRDGYWSPKSVLDLWFWLGNSYTPPRGDNARIALWLLDLPVGASLLTVALLGFWLGERLTRSIATS